ncbi:MAG: glycosyltransferase family 4 protein [Vicinamibacterales bacterium]
MSDATGLLAGGIALVVSAGATWLTRAGARRLGFVARPNPIVPQHTRPVAHLGGLGVAAGLGAGLLAAASAAPGSPVNGADLAGLIAGALGFLVLGALDDIAPLHAAAKFALQAVVATSAVALGVWTPLTHLEALDLGLALLWILTIVNACNVTDVCDGLLSGLTVVAMLLMAIALPGVAPAALACAGACAGFLVFNRPPATIFLGDTGSLLVGFVSAALALQVAAASASPVTGALAGALVLGVPLFELAFLTAVRIRKGLPWWRGSPDHFALRLQAAGLSRTQTTLVACAAGCLCGVGALALLRFGITVLPAIGLGTGAAAATSAMLLLRWEVGESPAGTAAHGAGPAPRALEGAGS